VVANREYHFTTVGHPGEVAVTAVPPVSAYHTSPLYVAVGIAAVAAGLFAFLNKGK
jgi:hypothetical protein